MTNGHFDFELEGVKYSLHFGMTAAQIFSEKSMQEVRKLMEETPDVDPKDLVADNVKSFAYMIYAGMCNEADREERKRPSFTEVYDLTERVLLEAPEQLQHDIFEAYNGSKATEKQRNMLNTAVEKKKTEILTGMKSELTPTDT